MNFVKIILLTFTAVLLSACISVNLVDQYNPEIEKGVNSYHKAAASFVATAVEKQQPYNSPEVQKFYSEQGALIRNMLINSEVISGIKPCVISRIQAKVQIPSSLPPVSIEPSKSNLNGKLSCTYLALNQLYAAHVTLADIHKLDKRLSAISSEIQFKTIEDAVRIVLQQEQIKKGD